MKTKIAFSLILAAGLLFGSCSKHNNTPAKPKCTISNISDGGTIYQVTYNANGKVKSVSSTNGFEWDYTYSSNTVVVTVTDNGAFQYKTTSNLNTQGLPINSVSEFDNTGTKWSKDNFEYDGNLLKKITNATSDDDNYVYTYINDGNNIIQAHGGINGSTDFKYYADKKNQPGGYINYSKLIKIINPFASFSWGMGFYGFDNKNLLKSVFNDGLTTNISYDFDADGKMTSMTIAPQGYSPKLVQYQYECK